MTTELIDDLTALKNEVEAEKRMPFNLFALVLREDLAGLASTGAGGEAAYRWDLVVSAPWVSVGQRGHFDYFAEKLKQHIGSNLPIISRIALLLPTDPFVQMINQRVGDRDILPELIDVSSSGMDVKQVRVFASQKADVTAQ